MQKATAPAAPGGSAVTDRDITDTGSVRLIEARYVQSRWVVLRDGNFPARVKITDRLGTQVTLTTIDVDGDDRREDVTTCAAGELVPVLDVAGWAA